MNKAKRYLEKPINKKILCIIGVIFLCVSVYDYVSFSMQRISMQYERQLEETGKQIAGHINRHMRDSIALLDASAIGFERYEDIHSEEALQELHAMSEKLDFSRMWLTKINGDAISSEGVRTNAEGREYIQRAAEGKSGISQVQTSKVNGKKNVVVYAPIYENQEVAGMVIGIYELDSLETILNTDYFDGKGHAYIYKPDGEILVGPEDKTVGLIITSGKEGTIQSEESKVITYQQELHKNYAYYCPIGINDWKLLLTFPNEIITKDLSDTMMATIGICVKIILILSIYLFLHSREKNNELRKLAQLDSMTALRNHGSFELFLDGFFLKEQKENSVLILFDVDKFKRVNDTLGHVEGDRLIIKIAELMKEFFRGEDIIGRLGGDEFAIFLKEVYKIEEIEERMKTFMNAVEGIAAEFCWDMTITISVGIAVAPAEGMNFNQLYESADKYMYESKLRGGNQIVKAENYYLGRE